MRFAISKFNPNVAAGVFTVAFAGVFAAPSAAAEESAVSVQATGGLFFDKPQLDFGTLALGETKKLRAVLRNRTTRDIALTGAKLAGQLTGFAFTATCGEVLPAGQSCVYTVAFKSKTLKARKSRLEISTGDADFPVVKLPLAGNLYPALNDTGITACANNNATALSCPIAGFPRQDAEQGRDKSVNRNKDGHAGFNFTKLDANGAALPASAKDWQCVRDNTTGLVWERKAQPDGAQGNQGLHDGDDLFTWYSRDDGNNNGDRGDANRLYIRDCYGYHAGNPASYCNTEAFVARVNAAGWCGAKDWRLPTRKELRGLADLSVPYAYEARTIDRSYFPDTLSHWYWTSSSFAGNARYSYVVSFTSGYADGASRAQALPVRLVRGGR
ncbi:MAG: Lcl domain-containing protein [Gammaproteobacteria bacterium]